MGVPRSTPDYFALQVLNTVLGGSFTSRLNQNLREEHGYSYGASSRFDMRLSAGPFLAGAGVQTDKTAESLKEFFKELNAIGAPISAEELTKAKNYLALGFPSDFETIGDLAARLEEMAVYKLPDNYYTEYVQNIQAVTAAAVQKAAATYIQPGKFAVVVVGDRKAIEPGIRALNLGADSRPVRGRGAAMSVGLSLVELLDYSDYERAQVARVGGRGSDAAGPDLPGGRPLPHHVEPRGAHLPGGAPAPGAAGGRHAAGYAPASRPATGRRCSTTPTWCGPTCGSSSPA